MDVTHSARAQARKLFLYLTGESGSSSSKYPFPTSPDSNPQSSQTAHRDTRIGRGEGDGGFWSNLTGLFSGIGKGVSGGNSSGSGRKDEWRETYEEGEVHCDLMKVSSAFTFGLIVRLSVLFFSRTKMEISNGGISSLICRVCAPVFSFIIL